VVELFFEQVQSVNDNFSYIIADEAVSDAAVVDVSYNASEIIVPDHEEIAKGTLKSILRQANLTREEFLKLL
jgi:hypothetical protein